MDRVKRDQQGSATTNVLVLVVVMTIIFLGAAFYIEMQIRYTARSLNINEAQENAVNKAREILEFMSDNDDDKDFFVDSPYDPVWKLIDGDDNIEMTDVSSRLNLNTLALEVADQNMVKLFDHFNEKMLKAQNLKLLKDPQKFGVDQLKDYRKDHGLILNHLYSFSDFFDPEVLEEYFTEYGYFNFNIHDVQTMAALYQIRTDSNDNFRDKYVSAYTSWYGNKTAQGQGQNIKYTKDLITTPQDLESWFNKQSGITGKEFTDKMFPLLNTEPAWNLYFLNEDILLALLSFEPFKISEPEQKIETLRKKMEEPDQPLTRKDIEAIIKPYGDKDFPMNLLLHYMGLTTWFWKLSVREGDYVLTWIVARIPVFKPDPDKDKPIFQVVEERFERNPAPPTPQPSTGPEATP